MLYDDYRFNQFKQHRKKCMSIHRPSSIHTSNIKSYIMNIKRVTNFSISCISICDHRVNLLVPSLEL